MLLAMLAKIGIRVTKSGAAFTAFETRGIEYREHCKKFLQFWNSTSTVFKISILQFFPVMLIFTLIFFLFSIEEVLSLNEDSRLGHFSFPASDTNLLFNFRDTVAASWTSYSENSTTRGCLSLWYWLGQDPWRTSRHKSCKNSCLISWN